MNETLKYLDLIHIVFKTDKGEELLKFLESIYVDKDLFDRDPYETAKNVAKRDLIQEFRRFLTLSRQDITENFEHNDSLFD